MRKLLIFGCGAMARVAHYYFSKSNDYSVEGFIVDPEWFIEGQIYLGSPVFNFNNLDHGTASHDYEIFVALGPSGNNGDRQRKCDLFRELGYVLASYISPFANLDSNVGDNCFIASGAVINPFVQIGNNCFIFENAIVCSDAEVGSNCYLSPGAYVGSFAKVDSNCVLGANSTVMTRVKVSSGTLVGANALVNRNTVSNGVYAIRPAEFYGDISHKIDISNFMNKKS
jgi:sugar O-acyltransferase (sialic acid O-acetyltransferase NeuD family)